MNDKVTEYAAQVAALSKKVVAQTLDKENCNPNGKNYFFIYKFFFIN
jgi:hypothetical protein